MLSIFLTLCVVNASSLNNQRNIRDDSNNMYENSDFIETEQPELSPETKELISLYQRDPTEENYLNLREMVIANYNSVLEKKQNKLAELRNETAGKPGGDAVVDEMYDIVQEMFITYWSRINSNMLRFSDTRLLKWNISDAPNHDYIPVMGAGETIYVKRTPVTTAEYAEFIKATGHPAPSSWTNGNYPSGEEKFPVNYVGYDDAVAYCDWLTEEDGTNVYRMPSESEWELAAGHMPKDAPFNSENISRTPVDAYEGITRGAHGAIDFWGNVWEWTSTVRTSNATSTINGIKGGSYLSDRTDCRTEVRNVGRDVTGAYIDVGFRVIQVLNGEEPEVKVELATLDPPVVTATDCITLSWQKIDGATEYQLFEYDQETKLFTMMNRTSQLSMTIPGLELDSTHLYLVQPISYVEICDNVAPENCISATCSIQNENLPEINTEKSGTSNENVDNSDESNDNSGGENKSDNKAGIIAGVVCAVVACAVIAGLVVYFIRKRKGGFERNQGGQADIQEMTL